MLGVRVFALLYGLAVYIFRAMSRSAVLDLRLLRLRKALAAVMIFKFSSLLWRESQLSIVVKEQIGSFLLLFFFFVFVTVRSMELDRFNQYVRRF